MKYIEIAPGMHFSRIVQGFWRLHNWNMSSGELEKFVCGCLDRGVNTFDTAEIYGSGQSEEQLGKVLPKRRRDEYTLVTKTGISVRNDDRGSFTYYDTTYDNIINACKGSLRRLKCDYVDLYLIHREDPLIDHHEVAAALKELMKQGLIKEAGVSNFDPFKFAALNELMDGQLRTNQIEWNPCCFEHFNSGMMDVLTQKHIHPMIWSPLCGGRLLTSEEAPYAQARKTIKRIAAKKNVKPETLVFAWILYHPVQAIALSGSSRLERLDAALAALDVELDRSEWYEIYVASKQQVIR
ncbi:MAG: aldo/keto reductase [Candidatus Pelethousia sp.]|nr:aldo/keto reductase [Candidatus Pelethousia sp.]